MYCKLIIKKLETAIVKNNNKSLIFSFFDIKARKKKGYVINMLVFVASASPRNNADNLVLFLKKK
jgi:hypothetical protein